MLQGRRCGIARELLGKIQALLTGQYTLDGEIAHGGAARVFRARDKDGRAVALKVLRPELAISVTAERFLREIGLMNRVDHPRIPRILDSGQREWLVYYVMPFIEGPTLQQHLDRVRRASVSDLLRIADDLLDALGYAHDIGIVHRDVKPANIVLPETGAMLLDFGVARAIAAAGTDRVTRSGFTVGTSAYISPEQVAGSDTIDPRSDLYSLGCVLFECLAGRPPFVHARELALLHMHTHEAPPDVRLLREDTPVPVAEAIARALAKDPAARWQTAGAMREALKA
jgi:serine/threonine-protein kinase